MSGRWVAQTPWSMHKNHSPGIIERDWVYGLAFEPLWNQDSIDLTSRILVAILHERLLAPDFIVVLLQRKIFVLLPCCITVNKILGLIHQIPLLLQLRAAHQRKMGDNVRAKNQVHSIYFMDSFLYADDSFTQHPIQGLLRQRLHTIDVCWISTAEMFM